MRDAHLGLREFVALMAALMSLNALAIDIMLPALPAMGEALSVAEPNHRQYVIIAYVWGLGVAQLFFGPVSDRFGRRGPLMVSLVGYSMFGLMCIFAPTFGVLVAARAAQGAAAAGARVISLSVVRDVHSGRQMARIMSLVMMVFMAVPMIAPNLGQGILFVASWRWVFGVVVVLGVLVTGWVFFRLNETHPPEKRSAQSAKALMSGYAMVFKTRVTCGYMIAMGVVFGALFAFISSSEQVYRDVFDKGSTFTLYFASITAVMAVAAFINSRLVGRLGMRRLAHLALAMFTIVHMGMGIAFQQGAQSFWLFHVGMGVTFFCFSFIGANFNALAMEPLGKIAGTASAALGFASTMIAGTFGAVVGQQFDGTAVPLTLGSGFLGLASFLIVAFTERGRMFTSEPVPT